MSSLRAFLIAGLAATLLALALYFVLGKSGNSQSSATTDAAPVGHVAPTASIEPAPTPIASLAPSPRATAPALKPSGSNRAVTLRDSAGKVLDMHDPASTWQTAKAQLTRGDDAAFRATFDRSVTITDEDIFRCRRHLLGTPTESDFTVSERSSVDGKSTERVKIEERSVRFSEVDGNWLAADKWCLP